MANIGNKIADGINLAILSNKYRRYSFIHTYLLFDELLNYPKPL